VVRRIDEVKRRVRALFFKWGVKFFCSTKVGFLGGFLFFQDRGFWGGGLVVCGSCKIRSFVRSFVLWRLLGLGWEERFEGYCTER